MIKIAVIGVGSAGIQTLCHLLTWMGEDWQITSIHDPKIPILGIGESTNPPFIQVLEDAIDLEMSDTESLKELDATYKLGTEYTGWRDHTFTNPFLSGSLALHIDTHSLKNYAIPKLQNRWGDRFSIIEGRVDKVKQSSNKVYVSIGGEVQSFDYVVECSGFPKDINNEKYETPDTLLDSCLVHNISNSGREFDKEIHTTGHIATKHGWVFKVPLQSRVSYGYLYNSTITTEEAAREDFSDLIKVKELKETTKYTFSPYIDKNIIDGRVISCGNKAAFFEPMFANSLWMYDLINMYTVDYILSGADEKALNEEFVRNAQDVLDVIALHYLEGSTFNTEFWDYATKWSTSRLLDSPRFLEHFKYTAQYTRGLAGYRGITYRTYPFGPTALTKVTRNLGYSLL